MFLPDVKPALEIGGSIGGCLGNFAIPGLMWVIHSHERKTSWKNLLAIALAVFGVISAGLSGWYAVRDAITAFKSLS
jgi:CDP-diglyceride synthetase